MRWDSTSAASRIAWVKRGTARISVISSTCTALCSTKTPVGSPLPSRWISTPLGAAASHLRASADGHHAPGGHRQRLSDGAAWVEREDAPALENPVDGYFIHPFSRYARSAPGCKGMPTFSGRHADFGSNSTSPAWPRTSASLLSRTVLVIVYATGSGSSVFVITTVGNPTVVSGFAWPLNVSAGIVAGT